MFVQKGFRNAFYIFGLTFIFVFNQQPYPPMPQLQGNQWSRPETIPLYESDIFPPILLADQDLTVHAFSSQWADQESNNPIRAIVYNRWSIAQGWTTPVDVILSPSKEARITDAHLDQNRTFHLIFFGGDGTKADIYYSQAPAAIADDARSWSSPIIIGEDASDPESAVMVVDNEGNLHVFYAGRRDGSGVYVVTSKDSGKTWSDATPIFLADQDSPVVYDLHAIQSEDGSLHVIWSIQTIGGQGRGIYYTRSDTGTGAWSDPVLLAVVSDGLGIKFPTIIDYNGSLFLVYFMAPKIMMRHSIDNGLTWSSSAVIFPRHIGVNGWMSMVIDSNNSLHLFFGQRITGNATTPDIHGMWHSMWTYGHWTEPEALVKGPRVDDKIGNKSFDPSWARAVVIQGNILLVTWRQDPGLNPNGIWYSYKVLDAPQLPLAAIPTLELSTTTSASLAPVPAIVPSPTTSADIALMTEPRSGNAISSLEIGITIAVLMLLVFMISYRLSVSHRK